MTENEDRLRSHAVIPGLATARARGMRTKPFPPLSQYLHRQSCLVNAVIACPPLSLVCFLLFASQEFDQLTGRWFVSLLRQEHPDSRYTRAQVFTSKFLSLSVAGIPR